MMKLLVCLCLMLAAITLTMSTVVGGYNKLNVESEIVKNLTILCLDRITQQTGSNRTLAVAKIESAESQVVSGLNYKIGMVVCEQDSAKENQLINEACRFCCITIWEQSWLNSTKVTNVNCSEPGNLESLSSASLNKME